MSLGSNLKKMRLLGKDLRFVALFVLGCVTLTFVSLWFLTLFGVVDPSLLGPLSPTKPHKVFVAPKHPPRHVVVIRHSTRRSSPTSPTRRARVVHVRAPSRRHHSASVRHTSPSPRRPSSTTPTPISPARPSPSPLPVPSVPKPPVPRPPAPRPPALPPVPQVPLPKVPEPVVPDPTKLLPPLPVPVPKVVPCVSLVQHC